MPRASARSSTVFPYQMVGIPRTLRSRTTACSNSSEGLLSLYSRSVRRRFRSASKYASTTPKIETDSFHRLIGRASMSCPPKTNEQSRFLHPQAIRDPFIWMEEPSSEYSGGPRCALPLAEARDKESLQRYQLPVSGLRNCRPDSSVFCVDQIKRQRSYYLQLWARKRVQLQVWCKFLTRASTPSR